MAAHLQTFPPLHAILDVDVAARAGWAPLALAQAFVSGGATIIQLRAKHLASGPLLQLCDQIVAVARPRGARIIVNDRVDVAVLAAADGAHVGQEDLGAAAARALLGPDAILGLSTHDESQLQQGVREPISYVAVGPIFGTRTKETGYDAVGLDLVRAARRFAPDRPVVAIGGITLDTAPSVLAAGASAVAVISDLLAGADPEARVRAYLQALTQHRV